MSTTNMKASVAKLFVLHTCLGMAVGLAVVAAYAYSTAEWWLTGRAAGYAALALVPLATMVSGLVTSMAVGHSAATGRHVSPQPILLAGIIVFAVAAVVRVYPLHELTYQLPGYVDTSPSLSRVFDELKLAELPLLGRSLGSVLTIIYLVVEAVVLLFALVLIARYSISAPYCYSCRRYCRRTLDVGRFAPAPLVQAIDRARAHDWSFFRALGPPDPIAEEWLRMDVASCEQCQLINTVSLQVMSQHGKRHDHLVHDIKITQDDLRTVTRLASP